MKHPENTATFEVVIKGNISPKDIDAKTLAEILKAIKDLSGGAEIALVGIENLEEEP